MSSLEERAALAASKYIREKGLFTATVEGIRDNPYAEAFIQGFIAGANLPIGERVFLMSPELEKKILKDME